MTTIVYGILAGIGALVVAFFTGSSAGKNKAIRKSQEKTIDKQNKELSNAELLNKIRNDSDLLSDNELADKLRESKNRDK